MSATLRPATARDLDTILALNRQSEGVLSPLSPARLAHLHAEAAYHRVAAEGDDVVAFLLALREGSDYDSVNYRWFAGRYDTFLYVDRVVVADTRRGEGLGARLYDDLFAFARAKRAVRVTCEFDVDPPNETSRRFHARYGFREVGTQVYGAARKQVSLQEALLTPG